MESIPQLGVAIGNRWNCLGHVISKKGVAMDELKFKAMLEWPRQCSNWEAFLDWPATIIDLCVTMLRSRNPWWTFPRRMPLTGLRWPTVFVDYRKQWFRRLFWHCRNSTNNSWWSWMLRRWELVPCWLRTIVMLHISAKNFPAGWRMPQHIVERCLVLGGYGTLGRSLIIETN